MEVEARMTAGDEQAAAIFAAMAYQIAKELGAMAAALAMRLDGVILTGGMSRSKLLVSALADRLSGLAPFHVYPGEREMEALALGALRVLRGDEEARYYGEASP